MLMSDVHGVKAKQLTADGVISDKRAYVNKVVVFHPLSQDSTYSFYDSATSSVSGLTPYTYAVYGKGTDYLDIPKDGVLFENGIYATVETGTTLTVFYTEA
jgi:hypothetical protein